MSDSRCILHGAAGSVSIDDYADGLLLTALDRESEVQIDLGEDDETKLREWLIARAVARDPGCQDLLDALVEAARWRESRDERGVGDERAQATKELEAVMRSVQVFIAEGLKRRES